MFIFFNKLITPHFLNLVKHIQYAQGEMERGREETPQKFKRDNTRDTVPCEPDTISDTSALFLTYVLDVVLWSTTLAFCCHQKARLGL